jgi:acyl-CoA synthetase (AMP-forming)/AMP-acid ligase II
VFGGSWLLTYPPSTFAGIQVLLTAISSRSTLVAFRSKSVSEMTEAMAKHAITHVSATPTFWRAALMVLSGSTEISSLRQITIGGETVDQGLLDRLSFTFPSARIIHIYASTEAGALFSVKDGRAGFPEDWLSMKIDGVELRIKDGILQVRSPRSMQSYVSGHGSPRAEDGWISTGDLVEVRGGRVYFSGRKDNTINVGGAKVLPEEVERFVLGIEGVVDVCVTGMKNPLSGAVLRAEVVAAPGTEPERLRKMIAQRCHAVLPAYQVPRIIQIVPQISVSAAGKKLGGVACDT